MHPASELANPHGRARLGVLLALVAIVALIAAACGGTTTTTNDPYEVASKAADATYDQVKVQVGISGTADGQEITIDPSAIEIVVDTEAGKGSFHLSLPVSALGSDVSMLQGMGVTGDTLDIDVLFDGEALYAKSPLAATLLPLLMMQSGQTLSGDLTGWLKLGTTQELAGLSGVLGATPGTSASPGAISNLDVPELKSSLEESGIVLTYVGSENHNGVDSDHLALTIDPTKLASGPLAGRIPTDQLGSLEDLAAAGTLSADMWLDKGTGRLTELAIHGSAEDGSKAEITILVSTPDGASFDAPAEFVEVPLAPLLQTLMQSFGGSLTP